MTKRVQILGAAVAVALIFGAAWAQAQKQAGGPKTPKSPPTAFMSNFYTRTISGKVTQLDGTPAANIPVHARFRRNMTGAEGENKDVTDAQGRYAMRVSAEEFVVMVDNGGTSYLSESHLADVRTKSATDINLTLHLTPRVTVRVHDALTGQPVEGVKIVRFGRADAQTGKDGTFTFRMLGFEEHLELRPEGSNLAAAPGYSFYRSLMVGSLSGTRRDPYVLEPDKDVTWDVRTYRNEPGAEQTTFRGIVTGPDGHPIAGARIAMTREWDTAEAASDSAGRWSFPTRRIGDDEARRRAVIIRAFKDDLAGLVRPTAEETWTQIPLPLRPNPTASLSGIMADAQGHPISGVLVEVMENFQSLPGEESARGISKPFYTDSAGRFSFDGLWPEGLYQLRSGGQTNRPLPSPAYGLVWLPEFNKSYRLNAREQRDLGKFVLPLADQFVDGRVMDKQGKPVAGIRVAVRGKNTFNASSVTDADGQFRVEHLVREPLTLEISRERVGTGENGRIYKGVYGNDIYLTQPIQAGQTNLKLVIGAPVFEFDKPSAKP